MGGGSSKKKEEEYRVSQPVPDHAAPVPAHSEVAANQKKAEDLAATAAEPASTKPAVAAVADVSPEPQPEKPPPSAPVEIHRPTRDPKTDATTVASPSIKGLRKAKIGMKSAAMLVVAANRLKNAGLEKKGMAAAAATLAAAAATAATEETVASEETVPAGGSPPGRSGGSDGRPQNQRILKMVTDHFGCRLRQVTLEDLTACVAEYNLEPEKDAPSKKMALVNALGVFLYSKQMKKE